MTTYEIIEKLCDKEGIAVTSLEATLGFGRGSIGKLKNGGGITATRLKMIADYFNVTIDYLMNGEDKALAAAPELNKRDLRDIEKTLSDIDDEITNGATLYYGGAPSDIDEDTRATISNALRIALTTIKKENKKKYNPNKNKQVQGNE